MLVSAAALIFVKRSSQSWKETDRAPGWLQAAGSRVGGSRWYPGYEALLGPHVRFAHHGVGLASARLTVSKDANIVALKGVEQHLLTDVLVHPHLGGKAGIIRLWTCRDKQPLRPAMKKTSHPLKCGDVGGYRSVGPVGVVEAEALAVFLLSGVDDS